MVCSLSNCHYIVLVPVPVPVTIPLTISSPPPPSYVPIISLLCSEYLSIHKLISFPDRPLIRIKRKGRPFATCSICHSTPCESPSEHARQKREAELKAPSKVTQTQSNKPFPRPEGRSSKFQKEEEEETNDTDGVRLMISFWFLESNARQTIPAPP